MELRSLARSTNPGDVSWKKAKTAILSCASELRDIAGQSTPPIDLAPILPLRRITRELYVESQNTPEAFLMPTQEGFSIGVRPNQSHKRERFSKAHELAHTFFYDLTATPPRKLLRSDDPLVHLKEEDICHAFASELLFPESSVAHSVELLLGQSDAEVVRALSSEYTVSAEVVIRHLLTKQKPFAATVALINYSRAARPAFRKWYGGSVKKPRVSELRLLSAVLDAAVRGSSQLAKVRDANQRLAAISWSTRADKNLQAGDYLMVDFQPSRRLDRLSDAS